MPICSVKLFYFPQLTLHMISAYMDITSEETVVSVYLCVQSLSHVQLFCDLMDCNPPGSSVLEFSRQAYWRGLLLPYSRGSPQPRGEPASLVPPALVGGFFITVSPGNPKRIDNKSQFKTYFYNQWKYQYFYTFIQRVRKKYIISLRSYTILIL